MTVATSAPDSTPPPVPDPTVITTQIINKEVTHLRELMESKIDRDIELCEVKFLAVEKRLAAGEAARVEAKADTKTAVDAALAAQKEAVREQTSASEKAIDKSEAATSKEIAQMSATFGSAIVGVTDAISDLKERVGKMENVKVGGQEAKAAVYALVGFIVSLIVLGGFVAAAWPK